MIRTTEQTSRQDLALKWAGLSAASINAALPLLRLARPPLLLSIRFVDRRDERFYACMCRIRDADLFTSWPAVLNGARPRPFIIGISADFESRRDPSRCRPIMLRRLLAHLTACPLYLHALARPDSMRHDIDGHPVEPVSDEHRAEALARLGGGQL
jgi:hypothetical protein